MRTNQKTSAKSVREMITHLAWSLDIEEMIVDKATEGKNIFCWEHSLYNAVIIEDDFIHAQKTTLWSVSEEGFISKLNHPDSITSSMKYILVEEKGFKKYDDDSEERWTGYYLFKGEHAIK